VLTISLFAALVFVLSPVQPAQAATFTVDTLTDSEAAAYQVCSGAANDCSLRGAIAKAAASAGSDTIEVPAGVYLLSLGTLVIDSSLSLVGEGSDLTIIDANFTSTVMQVSGGDTPTVTILDLTIRNGQGGPSLSGGGVRVSDGAYVTILRCVVENNSTSAPGGGLANSGTLIVTETTVRDNHVPVSGPGDLGGVQHSGGGIANFLDATLRVTRSTISDNSASRGGGIRNAGGHIEVVNSTISGNFARARGGGIMNYGTAWIAYSTITDNEIDGLSEHPEVYSGGGGIYNDPGTDPDPDPVDTARVSIANSILAENRDNQLTSNMTHSPDCFSIDPSAFTSFRGNVVGIVRGNCNLADTIYGDDASFDQTGTFNFPLNPWLLSLANNGGPTRTHEIQQVSPALDRGDGITSATFFDCPETDQRGIERPQGEECDAGSFEIEQVHVPLGLDLVSNPLRPGVPLIIVALPADRDFDPLQQVDLQTLRFGVSGTEDSVLRSPKTRLPACGPYDINQDGLLDLACKFSPSAAGLQCGPNSVSLRAGMNGSSGLVTGSGEINVGPCPQ
jgi:hypothetical protein